MKTQKFKTLLLAFILLSCNKSSDPNPVIASNNGSAKLGGQNFAPSKVTVTDTGSGLEISMSDNSTKITVALDDKVAGNYTAKNTSSGRVQTGTTFFISVFKDGVLYQGTTGTLTLTVNADGTFSGTFSATLKSPSGQTLTITDGQLSKVSATPIPTGCRIVSFSSSQAANCDSGNSFNLYYNADGKIAKATSPNGGNTAFTYDAAGKLVGAFSSSANGSTTIEFIYTGTVLTSYKYVVVNSSGKDQYNYTIGYSGQNIVSITSTNNGNTYTSKFTYTNGNVTEIQQTQNNSSFISYTNYSNYDQNKNPYQLLAQTTGLPIGLTDIGGGSYLSLSNNNPGTRNSTIKYSYPTLNAQKYPTQINYRVGDPCQVSTDIVYSGCQ